MTMASTFPANNAAIPTAWSSSYALLLVMPLVSYSGNLDRVVNIFALYRSGYPSCMIESSSCTTYILDFLFYKHSISAHWGLKYLIVRNEVKLDTYDDVMTK